MVKVRQIVEVMENIAPRCLGEAWDNPGLHVGNPEWPVEMISIALDPTYEVIDSAWHNNVNLVITHHPLIFQPLYSLDPGDHVGRIIELALRKQVAVFCAHTNLDSARGGVNDMLAETIGLKSVDVLQPARRTRCKAVVYVPKDHEESVLTGLFEAGLGKGDKYTCLSFRTKGTGTFLPGAGAKPFLGHKGELNRVEEFRVEIGIETRDLPTFRDVLARVHPYEEVVYDLYPLQGDSTREGLGRLGSLSKPTSFDAFVKQTKSVFGLSVVKTAGNPKQAIERVAVCGGSGRSLLGDFLSSDADVLISGDMGYHDGQQVADAGKGLIDIGHFSSEQVMVEGLSGRLSASLASKQWEVTVVPFTGQSDCFRYV